MDNMLVDSVKLFILFNFLFTMEVKFLGIPSNYEILYLPTDCNYSSIPFNLGSLTNSQSIYIVNDSES